MDRLSHLYKYGNYKIIYGFSMIYIFLQGFVFKDPSFVEFLFIPIFIYSIFNIKFTKKDIILFLYLSIPVVLSSTWGIMKFGGYNLVFSLTDIYLILSLIVLSRMFCILKLDDSFLDNFMKVWIIAGLINILVGLYCYMSGDSNIFGISVLFGELRLKGFFQDPNVLGPFLIVPTLYILENTISDKKIKIKPLLLFFIFSISVFLTFSRAAWINLSIGIVVILIKYIKIQPKNVLKLSILIITLVIVLLNFQPYLNNNNFYIMFENRASIQSYDQDRFKAQYESYNMVKQSMFLGIGPGNYESITSYSAHSLYLRMLGERGIIGFTVLIIFIIKLLADSNNFKKGYIFLLASLCGILVNSIFIDTLHWRHLYIIMALIIAYSSNYKKCLEVQI